MTKQETLKLIEKRIDEMYKYPEPSMYMSAREKKIAINRSINRWAAEEFVRYLKGARAPWVLAAERYIDMVDDFSTHNQETSVIFSIAYDVAVDLSDACIFGMMDE